MSQEPAIAGVDTLLTSVREGRQLCLFENVETATQLDTLLWCHSFDRQESTLQPIAPYAGKLQSGMVQALLELYSQPGDVVLDPFAGSGIVPFEALCADRAAWANDLNPYAYVITRGKLEAPRSARLAMQEATKLLDAVEAIAQAVNLEQVPGWVQAFFHPDTLREIVAAFQLLQQQQNYFLMACLLGILHHVLPGYLSYPSNQQAPYLRRVTYSPEEFPHLYAYRDVRSRLLAKIKRLYRRHQLPSNWDQRQYQVWQTHGSTLAIADETVDVVISRPPHVGAFDCVRDHRLRLWFLGYAEWKAVDANLISSHSLYLTHMPQCLQEVMRVLKPRGYCVFVLNDVERLGKTRGTAERLAHLAVEATQGQLAVETVYDHYPATVQRTQPRVKATKFDRVLVMRK